MVSHNAHALLTPITCCVRVVVGPFIAGLALHTVELASQDDAHARTIWNNGFEITNATQRHRSSCSKLHRIDQMASGPAEMPEKQDGDTAASRKLSKGIVLGPDGKP